MARLKLRELLMPEVVSQVEGTSSKAQRVNKIRSWAVSPGLFPCQLSDEAKRLCQGEPAARRKAGWGVGG
jgi:hypothetical protein